MKVFGLGQNRQTDAQPPADSPKIDLKTLKEKPAPEWTQEERAALVIHYKDRRLSSGPRPTRAYIQREYGVDSETLIGWEAEYDEKMKPKEKTSDATISKNGDPDTSDQIKNLLTRLDETVFVFETITPENLTIEHSHSEPIQTLSSEERLMQEIMPALNDIAWSNMSETERENMRREALLIQLKIDQTRAHCIDVYSAVMSAAGDLLRDRWNDGNPLERAVIRETVASVWNREPILWIEDVIANDIALEREQLPTDADLYPVELIPPTAEPEPMPVAVEPNELSIEDRNKMIEEMIEEMAKLKVGQIEKNRQSKLLTALSEKQKFPDLALAVSWYVHFVLDNSDLSPDYWKEDFPGVDTRTIQECIVRALVRITWFMKAEDLTTSDDRFMEKLFNKVIAELQKITAPSN